MSGAVQVFAICGELHCIYRAVMTSNETTVGGCLLDTIA